ncbi:MAG: ribbon-helix-helix domain-containing protein [Candidatus Odinarchaeota archaeon]
MKVIAFKIYERQKNLIQSMVKKGFYPSFSEAIRTACWELLEELLLNENGELDEIDNSKIDRILQKNEKFLKVDGSLSSQKVATSAKFPMKMLRKIDSLVLNGSFKNRSEFIRYASSVFLMTDSEIFSVFLEQSTLLK